MTNLNWLFAGIAAGAAGMGIMWFVSLCFYRQYLTMKAGLREAVFIDGQFFYIVPANDYVYSSLNLPSRADAARIAPVFQD